MFLVLIASENRFFGTPVPSPKGGTLYFSTLYLPTKCLVAKCERSRSWDSEATAACYAPSGKRPAHTFKGVTL